MLHAFADGINARIISLQRIVDHDRAFAMQSCLLRQLDIRTHAGRHDHQIGGNRTAVLERDAGHVLGAENGAGVGVEQKAQAFRLQRLLQQSGGRVIELPVHQVRTVVHDNHVHALAHQAIGGFQSEQPAAYHYRMAAVARRRHHRFDILDIAEADHAGQAMALNRNDERGGTGSDQQSVVICLDAAARTHIAPLAVDEFDRIAGVQHDAFAAIPFARVQHDVIDLFVAGQYRR